MIKASYIARPGSDHSWDIWSGKRLEKAVKDLRREASSFHGVAVGVPATHCTTFSVRVPTTDEKLFRDMVYAQVEMRGLAADADSENRFAYHVVGKDENESLLSVDVLASDFPESFCLSHAVAYASAARFRDTPEDGLALWKEHERLVLSAKRHGQVTYVQVLSVEADLSGEAAQEVNLSALTLQGGGLVGEHAELTVIGDFSEEGREAFEKRVLLPVSFRKDVLAPRAERGALDQELLPAAVRQERSRRQKVRQRTVIAAAIGAMYVVAAVGLWTYSNKKAEEIERLQAKLEETRPEVELIQQTAQRWLELEPAIELWRYPVYQLNEVTRVMPPSGVLIKEFETKGAEIRIEGQARDPQIAFQFAEDLKANEKLAAYDWNMPQPQVSTNNTATFEIRGQPRNANVN